jgi:ADP-ribosyl-[dinitrogen reductase] hydrolase
MGANPKVNTTPLRNTYWVLPGQVLAGEHPSGTTREATRERLQRLIEAGVECFIDLTEPGEVKPYDDELPFSVEYLRKPIRDHGIPAQPSHMAEILDCLRDTVQSGRCVYVHCRAGIGRTGTVIGCFLAERGAEGDAALNELNRLWQQSERAQSWGSVPETDEQERFVRAWKVRPDAVVFAEAARPGATNVGTVGADAASAAAIKQGAVPARGPGTASGVVAGRGPNAAATTQDVALTRAPGTASSVAAGRDPIMVPGSAPPPAELRPGEWPSFGASNTPVVPGALAADPSTGRAPTQGDPPRQGAAAVDRRAGGAAPPGASRTDLPLGGAVSQEVFAADQFVGEAVSHGASANDRASGRTPSRGAAAARAQSARDVAARDSTERDVPRDSPIGDPRRAGRSIADVETDPLFDPEALSAARSLRDRFLGAMLGLAVGDAVAAATQFRRAGTFTPVGDMLGGGPFDLPRGGWSDDTSTALCLADSLLACDGFDARDQMERYRQWQQEGYLTATGQCVGITASTARAIAMSQWRRQALFGSHDPSKLDPEPLSRVAAAVLFFFANADQAVEQATEAARTTCQAPAVLDACRGLARALHAAVSGQPKAVVLESAAVATGTSVVGRNGTGSSAIAALAAAAAAFGATSNFRDAILYAANLGGDSDVVAAVCGQLAGAFYGVKAIPTSWCNGLMQKELIAGYADRLLARAMVGLGEGGFG